MNNTELMNHPIISTPLNVGIYEYDGVKLSFDQVTKFGDIEQVKLLLNQITFESAGYQEEKQIENTYQISTQLLEIKKGKEIKY